MNEIEYAIEQLERRADAVSSIGEFEEYNALTTALTVLRAELARQDAKPLTWNERINQMTVDERAKHSAVYALVVERARRYAYRTRRNRVWEIESVMDRYMRKFLASPYTEGETK